jgi:hypothetical protein
VFALVMGLSLSSAAISTESGLTRCAAIVEAGARLACYDALAGRATRDNSPAPVPAAVPVPVPAPERASAAPPDPAVATGYFGLSAVQRHTADQGPMAIEARITRVIVDQSRRDYLVLDNGQTWAITQGEMLLDAGETVTIRRAALGSFMLTSASKRSYHVRRVR